MAATQASVAKSVYAGNGYTRSQLAAAISEKVSAEAGEISKKQVAAVLAHYTEVLIKTAKKQEKGAAVPGLGKLVLRKTPKRPARMGRNPATGEEIKIAAKPAGKKLVFRISKAAKLAAGVIKE